MELNEKYDCGLTKNDNAREDYDIHYFDVKDKNLLVLPHKNYAQEDLVLARPYDICGDSPESHQEKVICYCRTEDEQFIKEIVIDLYTGTTTSTIVKDGISKNPSTRRQGLSIIMKPEEGPRFSLNVSQHKGRTHINTTDFKEVPKPKVYKCAWTT